MRDMKPVLVHSDRYACDIGPHVFPTQKYAAVVAALAADGSLDAVERLESVAASREELLAVHTAEYLDDLEGLRVTSRTMWSELPLTAEIVTAYTFAAGGTIAAAREALARGAGIHVGGGFHHAFADRAEGFCYLNDLAVAARAMQREGKARRIAIVDLDVHQGNGTARIFAGDPDVFTFSMHGERNYPFRRERSTLDVELPDGCGDAEYLDRLDRHLGAVLDEAAPELVVYLAGADPYRHDRFGRLGLGLAGLRARDRAVFLACRRRGLPVVLTLAGGYARELDDIVEIHCGTVAEGLAAYA